jgi:hypothetical protein
MMSAERGRGGDEHEPQDHGGEHGAGDGAGPGWPAGLGSGAGRLFHAKADGLPHLQAAGQPGAEQGQAACHHVGAQRQRQDQAGGEQAGPVRMRQHRRHAESGEPQHQVPQHRHHLAVPAGQQQLGQSRPQRRR